MGDWPIGLSTGCFHDQPFVECLPDVRAAGFHIVEVCSLPAHLDYRDLKVVERSAARLRELELEAYSFHAPFAADIDITALDQAARQRAVAEISRAVEAAAMLGVRYFVLHPGFAGALILEVAGQPDRRALFAGAERARGFLRQLGAHAGLDPGSR
jgi:sugar phosphate isomerase/epimerase